MKAGILSAVILLLSFQGLAQDGYQRMFNAYNAWEWSNQLLHYDSASGAMNILGVTVDVLAPSDDSARFYGFYLANIDKEGVMGKNKLYRKNNYKIFIEQIPRIVNGELLLFMSVDDSLSNREDYICTIDTGTFETTKSIRLNKMNTDFVSLLTYRNGKWYGSGFTEQSASVIPVFMVFDSAGNQIKRVPFNGNYGAIGNVLQTHDGKILMAGFSYNSPIQPYLEANWYVLVDTLGHIIWERKVESPGTDWRSVGLQVSKINNHYYIRGFEYINSPRYAYVSEIDINTGDILWTNRFYETEVDDTESSWMYMPPKSYKDEAYAVGMRQVNDVQYGLFFKQDTLGNILWKRLYREASFDNYLFGVERVSDGFVLLGSARDTLDMLKDNVWIIKTDTLGCVVPGCHLYDGIPQVIRKQFSYLMYPNPANDFVDIRWKQFDEKKELVLHVYSQEGKEVLRQKVLNQNESLRLNVNDWPSGMYLFSIQSGGENLGREKILIQH